MIELEKRIRVLLSKGDQDGHNVGIKYLATVLKNAGIEVIFTRYSIIDETAKTAREEDVDVICLSFFGCGIIYDVSRLMNLLKEFQMEDVKVIVGGIISEEESSKVLELGVSKVFIPGMSVEKLPELLQKWMLEKRG